ncbi:MAG: 4Fe-4S dicluster domain-containing protein [Clostridia bacterium]|nr:4Fe-4S dicluster domain-containing protein [Clostridia bacterium]
MSKINGTLNKKRIFAEENVCVNCKLCEVYCAAAHSNYKNDVYKAFKKSPSKPLSRIIVEEKNPLSFGLQCRHCDNPRCVKSCITGAMQKDPQTGIVINDENRCIGCWTCILTCPFGAISRDYKQKKVASKCDFCMENGGEPACVKNCPNDALYIDEISSDHPTKGGGLK